MLALLFVALAAPLALLAFALGARFGYRRGLGDGNAAGGAAVYTALADVFRAQGGDPAIADRLEQFARETAADRRGARRAADKALSAD